MSKILLFLKQRSIIVSHNILTLTTYLICQRPLYNSFNHREAEVYAGFRVFQKLA